MALDIFFSNLQPARIKHLMPIFCIFDTVFDAKWLDEAVSQFEVLTRFSVAATNALICEMGDVGIIRGGVLLVHPRATPTCS
jgi:hypothetical protein